MSKSDDKFLLNAKREIESKIKTEKKHVEILLENKQELEESLQGYINYYKELETFIRNSMIDFTQNEEDLPKYFQSNLNEIYQNYVNIKKDAKDEIDQLNNYIIENKKAIQDTRNTLKFYNSQDPDSDFFKFCIPLVDLYTKKIEVLTVNQELTLDVIVELEKIHKKLINWV